ncbi:MAG TPA: hypothetical protein VIL09_10425 [Microvirga sp.]|jgi:hypothetical protein
MFAYKKSPDARSARTVMFEVTYDHGRAAYLWLDNHGKTGDDRLVTAIAQTRQAEGALPPGNIVRIRRVR